uniref:Transmembrane 9 superfamily member n=1 Tax=Tetraselmis sp. GSL018 TaxID=582737 RepID=A0A061RAB8_9CHLO|eukprot:CAMPEP_0177595706 /NCGR_PEP_ID=MMETSP0419_2-20121207/10530_1 /TAXON_ID=582737 /ORGANISM="Tetraselmis sp., Strain GSL018" /LENGTH=602 /DNA_ID=CAMNT_0019087245 /DNA_START=144 /DNA_END=1952 /DNA_ORIENTATION=+
MCKLRAWQRTVFFALGAAILLGYVTHTYASEHDHKYAVGDPVKLWVNKVGPYNNPQETYNYFTLPFCKPRPDDKPEHRWGGLGEVLEGNELINSQVDIRFRLDVPKRVLCEDPLSSESVTVFKNAIKEHYWYELFMDDLPIWGFVGEYVSAETSRAEGGPAEEQIYIYTHKSFDINYNGNRIIQVNLTSESPRPLVEGSNLEFTYSVKWQQTSIPFRRRFERYLDYNFFEHQIHWFSIFNSFMMVIFLTGLVSMILMRTLRNDYAKYSREEDDLETLERDVSEESGWKLVHGDVFRPPRHLAMLAALVGTGAQLTLLVLAVIVITIAGALFVERGTIVTVFIICYALTSFVGGYVSGSFYLRNEGKAWIRAMLLTAGFYPGITMAIAFALNIVAIFYHSLAAVPFGTMVIIALLWGFISFPLCLFGTVVGRNWNGVSDNPCRVKRIPSPIPLKKWYLRPSIVAALGGLLPFGSIFIEMYFIFTSFWNYKVYYVYGFMLLVFIILIIVTVCVTIVGTYFLLNAENYHWQWTSFCSAASTAGYVYLYSIHYFFMKTKMTGLFQTLFYFGYTAMFCLALGVICGATGYLGSSMFVRRIYRNIKCD